MLFPVDPSQSCHLFLEEMAQFVSECQLSFLLRAASDTLPTAVNLQRWSIQCEAKCSLCDSHCPTTAHVLSCCPTALDQQRYTFRHNQVLSTLVSMLADIFADKPSVKVYAN